MSFKTLTFESSTTSALGLSKRFLVDGSLKPVSGTRLDEFVAGMRRQGWTTAGDELDDG